MLRLKSFSGEQWHNICLPQRSCDCEDFRVEGRCDHLNALGIYPIKPYSAKTHPTFSQALSGLVKSLRIRRVEEAVYWLCYLDSFKEKQYRFRAARRLLIGSAEDGHSVPVMEESSSRFRRNSCPETGLPHLIEDAIRICKLPNWWQPETGGPDYIYQSLIGERRWLYKNWDHRRETLEREIAAAVNFQEKADAIGAVMAYCSLQRNERVGATKQAEHLLHLAEERNHDLAVRLCRVHLSQRSALSGDNNFLCQAAWMLAGGVSPIAERIAPVSTEECFELLERAKESWWNPHPIPRWCTDGIHSAGDDPRFAGLLPQMMAVCRAFQHYGRVNPDDVWLPQFQCLDGLTIQTENSIAEPESKYIILPILLHFADGVVSNTTTYEAPKRLEHEHNVAFRR